MTFVRTLTDKYGIEIIIDTTENEEFAKLHLNDWKQLSNTGIPGDFYYEGRAISSSSEDYGIIQELIFNEVEKENEIIRAKEEADRIQHEQELEAARLEIEQQEGDTSE